MTIPQDIKLIGYFGRFVKEKGLDQLVEALSQLDNYYLMLVGGGDYGSEYSKRTDYYNCLDVFVLPSKTVPGWKEQYGRVLVEAMGCGISVVGSSSGAIPEVLEGYPKGLIFKEGDVDDLVEKIKETENLRFPENFNLDKFLYKFSVKNFVSEHINFYKNLIQ